MKKERLGKIKEIMSNKNLLSIFLFIIIIIAIIFLFIKHINKTYIIRFNSDGGTHIENIEIKKNTKVNISRYNPKKEKYIFNGWELNGKLLISGTIIDEDIELKASWLDLGYEYIHVIYSPGNGFDDIDILVEKNQRVNEPNILKSKDKIFDGWYLENKKFDFNTRLNNNIILHAKWKDENTKCINGSFYLKNGKCEKKISIEPIKSSYCSEGWEMVDNNCVKVELTGNSINATPHYSCDNGYILYGDICKKEFTATPSTTYSCQNGTLEGGTCYVYKDVRELYRAIGYGYSAEQNAKIKRDFEISCSHKPNSRIVYSSNSLECYVNKKVSVGSPILVTTCPYGYYINGNVCRRNDSINATITEFTCPDEYIKNDTKCYEKSGIVKKEKAKVKESCYDPFKLENGKCTMKAFLDKKMNVPK